MKFTDFFKTQDSIQLDKRTLVILRWLALVGQYITISIVYFYLNFEFLFFYCSIVIIIGAITNIYLQFIIKENQLSNFSSTIFLFYDLIQLSILLYLTGGIINPFAILLIIPSILSSAFLNLKSTFGFHVFY